MQCYTELIPPSGITNAISLPFLTGDAQNLVVARTSVLQIYSVCTKKSSSDVHETRLVLVAEYTLSGTITSLGRVKILQSKSGGEALLIAFRNAKLSLVEWDPEKYGLSTVSIHYYESEALQRSPWTPDLKDCVNHLTVDPSSRCAVFNFGVNNVAIIPFHQAGDDLVMEDYGGDFDETESRSPTKATNGTAIQTPYRSSFVLPLTQLDPGILHPIHIAFLHEYREPTFGILYSTIAVTPGLNYERKDGVQYAVFTLDLEQRASTRLQSIARLPNDLYKVISLPLPVGGALLVGDNEVVHVDQGGKTNAVAVNEYSRQTSAFPMADHSEMNLKLEHCQVEMLNATNGDMLIILQHGDLALLSFHLDGRSVASMSVRKLSQDSGPVFQSRASCTTFLGDQCLFVGSDVADSVLLDSSRKLQLLRKNSSRLEDKSNGVDEDSEEEEDDDDDDLYGEKDDLAAARTNEASPAVGTLLRILDRLPCSAPIRDFTVGRIDPVMEKKEKKTKGVSDRLAIVAATGQGLTGGVTALTRDLRPEVVNQVKLKTADSIWSFSFNTEKSRSATTSSSRLDKYILTSKSNRAKSESLLYDISKRRVSEKQDDTGDFDPTAGATIECGLLTNDTHLVQVLESDVKVFDPAFGLAQIWPVVDEEDDAHAKVVSACIVDPYVLLLKDDSSLLLLEADKKGELDEVELIPELSDGKFTHVTLYHDNKGFFQTGNSPQNKFVLVTLSLTGALSVFSGSDFQTRIFNYEGVQFLPFLLGLSVPLPRHWKGAQNLLEILIADLGDEANTRPYLLLRSSTGDVAIYEPFASSQNEDKGSSAVLRFKKLSSRSDSKTSSTSTAKDTMDLDDSDSSKRRQLRTGKVRGLSIVLVNRPIPAMIAKSSFSIPRLHDLATEPVLTTTFHNTTICPQGMAFVTAEGHLRRSTIPSDIDIGHSPWVQKRALIGHDVSHVSYLDRTRSFVLGCSDMKTFQLPQDDEWHPEWQNEKVNSYPEIPRGVVRLLSSATFKVISSHELDESERVLCMKSMSLEVSEESHERKDLIVVGTGVVKGEDVVARGAICIFDVVDVVPSPGDPESGLKLKLIAKEEVKGAVTSLCSVGSQGFLLAAQGQKCMVRGLKEDLSILPVAFMDMKYYVHVVKELPGTGLCLMGDAMSGLWFVGYAEEPYKLQLFGRDQVGLEVIAAEFLPSGKNLYMNVADGDGVLHVLQFDPDSPESERGMKLLHRSRFSSGSFITSTLLLPTRNAETDDEKATNGDQEDSPNQSTFQILTATQEGSLGLITPLPSATYQRLSALQNILISTLEHPCGLNPRSYRAVETDGIGGTAIVDGNMVMRWRDQDLFHQSSVADKVGSSVWELAEDLGDVGGVALDFL